jgi:hypothetical protein
MRAGVMGLADEAASSFRGMRAAVAIVFVALLAGLFASTARAEPLSMTFTEAYANVGETQLADASLFPAPETAPFAAQIDGNGLITGGLLTVPNFSTEIAIPVTANVVVEFEIGPIAGSFNQATGVLEGTGTARATLTADEEDTCNVATVPASLTLSTTETAVAHGSPRSGAPFTMGLTGVGAIAGKWTDMTATPATPEDSSSVCQTVQDAIDGPGGIWLKQGDIAPPAAPRLTSTDPASPNLNGAPRILGTAEAGSTVKIYAGSGCAGALVATGSAAELGSPGLPVPVPEGVTAFFSATATDAAGNASTCSGQIAYTRLKAPAGGPGGGDNGPGKTPVAIVCIVPKLAGKTLPRATKTLKRAGCKLGKVTKPKKRKGQKKLPALVVKSSSPRRGAKPANRKVDLKLGPKPKKQKPKSQKPKPRR